KCDQGDPRSCEIGQQKCVRIQRRGREADCRCPRQGDRESEGEDAVQRHQGSSRVQALTMKGWGMKSEEAKKLCLDLIHADDEEAVVQILKGRGLWDDPRHWRFYGDDELNWNRAGNQQARSDFAVNEKLVNTIDSRLMLECMLEGIDPESKDAPQS